MGSTRATTNSTDTSRLEGLAPGTYVIDPITSEVGFTVRHMMTRVRGQFREFEGTIEVAENLSESAVSARIELSSVDTRSEARDNHLRSADFFSVETTPTMTFQSTAVRHQGDGLVAVGDLTIGDVTHQVAVDVDYLGTGEDPWGGTRVGFEGSTRISRREWGIDFNVPLDGDKVMIGDKVDVVLVVQAVLRTDDA